ncbi:MAG: binding-protein-dependent transport system inner rane component [Defluviitaleaceae bacterium]|jgi:multiple sugar transport system permease protein|nr:carbohydrate ABC transporter permease [Defluviitalea raffinosedens]MBZ4667393.1 binding-protein-dependent transport system inner rane component [Defluviitaleaceae bacterium]
MSKILTANKAQMINKAETMNAKAQRTERIWRISITAIITFFMCIIVFPFFWILITSVKPTSQIFGDGAYAIYAGQLVLDHYITVIFEKGILHSIWNSFVVASVTTLYVVCIAVLAAYAISRFNFKGKSFLLGLILAISMFPQMIVVGPIYNLFTQLHLTNSYFVVLPYSTITLPSAVWIMVTHFNQIPLAIEESAKIDGATPFETLTKVIFPLAAPGVFTTGIITFIAAWNEYLLTVTLNTDKNYHTVPVAVSFLRSQFQILWGQVSAATIVVTIPTLIIVLLFQKQIVSGLISGAVKE